MEKIWVSIKELAISAVKSVNLKSKEYLKSAKQLLNGTWELFKSWYSPKKDENSAKQQQYENFVRNKIKEYLESAKDYLESFSRELKSWLRLPKISIQDFFQKKTTQFLNLAKCFFDKLSNIIKQGFDFCKVKIVSMMSQKFLNLARRLFESISETFKLGFDQVKVCIDKFVQNKLGSSNNKTSSRVKMSSAFLKFLPHFIELIKTLNNYYSGDEFDFKEMIELICEFLLSMHGYGDSLGIMERLVIESIIFFMKKLYKHELEDIPVLVTDFFHHMMGTTGGFMRSFSEMTFRFLTEAIKIYYNFLGKGSEDR